MISQENAINYQTGLNKIRKVMKSKLNFLKKKLMIKKGDIKGNY